MFGKKKVFITASDLTVGLWNDIHKLAEEKADKAVKKYNSDIEDYRVKFKEDLDKWLEENNIEDVPCAAKDQLAQTMATAYLGEHWSFGWGHRYWR